MQLQDWLSNTKAGKIDHDWAEIVVTAKGPSGKTHVGKFKVSAAPAKLKDTQHYLTCTAEAQQQTGDLLDALLLTSKLMEERWVQGTVKIRPHTGNVTKDKDGIEHSKRIVAALQQGNVDAVAGQWLVVDPCKTWILDERCTLSSAVNHGWIVPPNECKYLNDRGDGKPGWIWMGPDLDKDGKTDEGKFIVVSKCLSIDAYIIQNRGGKHDAKFHLDYSQMALYAYGWCEVDGEAMRTADVYMSAELACLVTYNGKPLLWSRQPGIVLLAPITPVTSGNQPDTDPAPVSIPGPMLDDDDEPWKNSKLIPGQRHLAFALAEMKTGTQEKPLGSNKGPRVEEFLKLCKREGQKHPDFGNWLANQGANWCAAFFSACQLWAGLAGDPDWGFIPRCSGLELENDAKKAGLWRPKDLVIKQGFRVEAGDGVILLRGDQGWERHVARYVRRIDEASFETIGGNENNKICLTTRKFNDAALLGFIEQPDPTPNYDADEMARVLAVDYKVFDKDEQKRLDQLLQLLYAADPKNDGDNLLVA